MWACTDINALVFRSWWASFGISRTVLIQACAKGAPAAHVATLLASGVSVDAVDYAGRTALYWASNSGTVEALLANGADPNIADHIGWTPLMQAIYKGRTAVVYALLHSAGAQLAINHMENDGYTALMIACYHRNANCVRMLLNTGADITLRNRQGRTAMDIASSDSEIIRLIRHKK